jgi:hypothetical protein
MFAIYLFIGYNGKDLHGNLFLKNSLFWKFLETVNWNRKFFEKQKLKPIKKKKKSDRSRSISSASLLVTCNKIVLSFDGSKPRDLASMTR